MNQATGRTESYAELDWSNVIVIKKSAEQPTIPQEELNAKSKDENEQNEMSIA